MVTHKKIFLVHMSLYLMTHQSDTTIKEAAMLAGYFSKAGNSGQIPVDYIVN